MSIFRLSDNLPEIYSNESRDFQLLCNSYDLVNNAVKFDIDSMVNVLDTRLCPERLIPLLQHKVGFFTTQKFTTQQLRDICIAFPLLARDKGSVTGIREAVNLWLRVNNLSHTVSIVVNNETHEVRIQLNGEHSNTTLLDELLKYVIPTGYFINYRFLNSLPMLSSSIMMSGAAEHVSITKREGPKQVANVDSNVGDGVQSYTYYGGYGDANHESEPTENGE